MTHEALIAIEPKMQRAVEAMERDFAGIRTGRASSALVERIMVDYYGTPTPVQQLASFQVPEARQVVELKWRTGAGEQEARYIAQAGSIEPRYLRTLGTDTLLMGAAVGFLAGLFTGRSLRRRWLARP